MFYQRLLRHLDFLGKGRVERRSAQRRNGRRARTYHRAGTNVCRLSLANRCLQLVGSFLRDRRNGRQGNRLNCRRSEDRHSRLNVRQGMVGRRVNRQRRISAPKRRSTRSNNDRRYPLRQALSGGRARSRRRACRYSCVCEATHAELITPMLSRLLVGLRRIEVHLLRHLHVLNRECKDAALNVEGRGHPNFVGAVTPLNSVISVRAATNLIDDVLLRRFTLSARNFLAVLPNVVRIKRIRQSASRNARSACHDHLTRTNRFPLLSNVCRGNGRRRRSSRRVVVNRLRIINVRLRDQRSNDRRRAFRVLAPVDRCRAHGREERVNRDPCLPSVAYYGSGGRMK